MVDYSFPDDSLYIRLKELKKEKVVRVEVYRRLEKEDGKIIHMVPFASFPLVKEKGEVNPASLINKLDEIWLNQFR